MHGVWANKGANNQWVRVNQVGSDGIELSHTHYSAPVMTAEQARYLASKLNRLAKRIESNA